MQIDLAEAYEPLLSPMRYKALMGGRGSGKSWAVADLLLAFGISKRRRILCTREFQASIKDSVHKLLSDRIEALNIGGFYEITQNTIRGRNGTEFIFKGLRHNITEIKSTEGIDICWVEEGEAVSEHSWTVLTPTVRKDNSEIWVVFNPDSPDDATYRRFVENKPDNCLLIETTFRDNPYFPDVLEKERLYDLEHNPDLYDWKWEGKPRVYTDAQIFKGKFELAEFEPPENVRWFFGMDFGFSTDPNTLIKSYIRDGSFYIFSEWFGYGVDLDDMEACIEKIEGSRRWPIKADNSRPETISFLKRRGFNISDAKKWKGSVEDGIAHLRNFKKIYIHPSCKNIHQEFRLYSYKVDRNGDVLPIIIDKHNHGIDAIRYSLDGYIKARGQVNVPNQDVRKLARI